jgi:hypothetical protein
LRQKSVYLGCFLLHFLLIITVSCRETLWLAGRGLTISPSSFDSFSQKAEKATAAALGQHLAALNPFRQTLTTYLHLAGIETGYGYFAPNVAGSYNLVFELHYPDGRVEYEWPRVNSASAGLRIAGLLDEIGRTHSDAFREYMVKMVAFSIWHEHPEVKTMRAILGSVILPSLRDFERGKAESYEFLYAYDFSLSNESTEPANR